MTFLLSSPPQLSDLLAARYDVVARFNGGANAGHTVVVPSTTGAPPKKFAFHQLPCGILHPRTVNLIGNGCVVHLGGLLEELKPLDAAGIDWKGAFLFGGRRAHACVGRRRCVVAPRPRPPAAPTLVAPPQAARS